MFASKDAEKGPLILVIDDTPEILQALACNVPWRYAPI
jgi:hypothetical protein